MKNKKEMSPEQIEKSLLALYERAQGTRWSELLKCLGGSFFIHPLNPTATLKRATREFNRRYYSISR